MRVVTLSNGWIAEVNARGITFRDNETSGSIGSPLISPDEIEALREALGQEVDMIKPLSLSWCNGIINTIQQNPLLAGSVLVTFIGRDERSGGYVVELQDTRTDKHHVARTVGEWRLIERVLYQV